MTEDEDGSSTGPKSIVYKKYGGNIFEEQVEYMGFKRNSSMIQSLIFYEMSKRAWGPKLYGLFEGGRIEEMVDCHTLTPDEAFTPEFILDVAKAYARFHSLQLPINKRSFDILAVFLAPVDRTKKQLAEFIESKNIIETDPLMSFKRLHDFPFHEECEWLQSIRPQIKQRTVLCSMDPHYLNRLVRNQKPSDPDATRTLIIDYDGCAYFDRGYDLGGHFVHGMFTNRQLRYPSEAVTAFLTAYLEETKKLSQNFDTNSLDSLNNLMLECEFNSLVYLITILIFFLKMHTVLDAKPMIWIGINPLIELYKEQKHQFCAKYPHCSAESRR